MVPCTLVAPWSLYPSCSVVPCTLVAPWSTPWTYSTFKLSWHSQFLEWKFLLVHSFNQGVSPKRLCVNQNALQNAKKRKLTMCKGCHLTTCVVYLPPKFSPLVSSPFHLRVVVASTRFLHIFDHPCGLFATKVCLEDSILHHSRV
jgi:hypothetical protein